MATETFDVIVIGVGVVGAAAAYHLAKRGLRVLALEQFELDHQNGSSYGESRIIRYAYKDKLYLDMAKTVYPMWRELEHESGHPLITLAGGFDFGPADYPSLIETRANLEAAGIPYEWLTPEAAAQRFPQFRLDDNMAAIYQQDAAVMNASACVLALVDRAQAHGALFKSQNTVTKIEPLTDAVRVQTPTETYNAGRAVLTAGAWTGKLLAALDLNLPLVPTRQEQLFFEPKNRALFAPGAFPVFIHHNAPWFYGLPDMGTGPKVAIHSLTNATDPDRMSRARDEVHFQQVLAWVKRFFRAGAGEVRETRVCLYTVTPDEHFIIDTHPTYPNIIIGSPCSGHGFKFGILTGRMLADLTQGQGTTHAMFSVRRFISQ
jgi:monomeric sarcosine oxidase